MSFGTKSVNREELQKLFAEEGLEETHLRQTVERQAKLNVLKLVARHAAHSRIDQVFTLDKKKREAFF